MNMNGIYLTKEEMKVDARNTENTLLECVSLSFTP